MNAINIQITSLTNASNHSCSFTPWRPEDGRVFDQPYALDTETTLIDERTNQPPTLVLAAACDGSRGFFLRPNRVLTFLEVHQDVPVCFHHAPFDLAVLANLGREMGVSFDVYDLVERDGVWDTLLLHRLYGLASEGRTMAGQSSLDHCAEVHLGCKLPKDTQDAQGKDVRTSFGQFLNRPPGAIPQIYLEYLGKDTLATKLLCDHLIAETNRLLRQSSDVWGFVSEAWLEEQVRRWGPQTHHIQLKAAIALEEITRNGMKLDLDRQKELSASNQAVLGEKLAALSAKDFQLGTGSSKQLQTLVTQIASDHPETQLAKTPTGRFATDETALHTLATFDSLFHDLVEYKAAAKLDSTYLQKMTKPTIHPRFDVLKTTGRTSSWGDINAQNLPRDDRIRRCFVPSDGHLFLDADYTTIEMATLAQSLLSQFGLPSLMAEAINAGKDLHSLVAARVTGKEEAEVTKEERSKAKPINFGKPGGMGSSTLQEYAKASYGITLNEEEVRELEDAWFDLFPEMDSFLADSHDLGEEVAAFLGLTVVDYEKACSSKANRQNGHAEGRGWLGWMLLKVLREQNPATKQGRFYAQEEKDYFWREAQALVAELPQEWSEAIRDRQPGDGLHKAVRNHFGRLGVFTLTGRLRAKASYCARHNTIFQGLAADGAKIALWRLWRAGFKVVNFIHDQVLVEVPTDANLPRVADDVEEIMVQAMKEVVPDVTIKVAWAYRERWSKAKEDEFLLPESSVSTSTSEIASTSGASMSSINRDLLNSYPGVSTMAILRPLAGSLGHCKP